MKVLLAQSTVYVPTHGGENKANRLLVEGLAARGHACRVVSPACGAQGPGARAQFLEELSARGLSASCSSEGVDVFEQNGVQVHAVAESSQLRLHLAKQIEEFEPTWTLISSEDPGQVLLETATKASPGRVVYLAHTMLFFPCGPNSFFASRSKTELLRQAAGIITVSQYLKDYIRRWAGCESAVIPFPVYGSGPFPQFGRFDHGRVTLINPCAYKGISIFLELARQLPYVEFLAVRSWGTTSEDRAELERLPNIRIVDPIDDIDQIFAQTRVLLVPSLWGEGFPLVPVEAMLRGIPVLASDSGGLPEAKLGVDYVIPVRPIEQYQEQFDDRRLPIPIVPAQNLQPWLTALGRVVSSREHYDELSRASRDAAQAYVNGLKIEPFEAFLRALEETAKARPSPAARPSVTARPEDDRAKRDILHRIEKLSPERRALLAMRLKKDASSQVIQKSLRPAGVISSPASLAQERLWFLEQLEPGNYSYNNLDAFRLKGPLNRDALARSLNEIVRRHETLRTTFAEEDGRPLQIVTPPRPVALTEVERPGGCADAERDGWIQRLIAEEAQRTFDLGRGPLIRAMLMRLGDTDHVLLLTTHHVISDGWSGGVIFRELAALYRAFAQGQPSPLPELPIQYADFARWQREWLKADVVDTHLSYWKRQLAGAPAVLELPTDRQRPAVQTFAGARESTVVSAALAGEIKALGRREGATLFMTLLGAFAVLLHRLTGQSDVVIGSAVAGRNRTETEGLIGFFADSLALRTDLSGDPSVRELLQRVRDVAVKAYAHQDVPFAKIVEEIQPDRRPSHSPVFQVMFVLQNGERARLELPGLTLESIAVDTGTAKFDLMLDVVETADGLSCTFEYNTDLFEAATIRRWLGHFQTLLQGIVSHPGQTVSRVPLLSETERTRLLVEWNQTARDYPKDQCLHELFEAQVARTPDAVALVFDKEQVSYRELNRRADRLGHYLRELGVQPDGLVGLCMERSVELVVALLGILKAGGAYVPLDPSYPRDRLSFMLADADVPVLLTQPHLRAIFSSVTGKVVCLERGGKLWPHGEQTGKPVGITPNHLAYVIYTSGSTGRPKGAMNTHKGVCNRLLWMQEEYQLREDDRVLQKTPFSFDVSVWEFFWPLITGARLVVARPGVHQDPRALASLMREEGITTLHFVPSMLQVFLEQPDLDPGPSLRRVICSGEALPAELQRRFFSRLTAELHNLYGPTEAAIDVTYWACERDSVRPTVPIGRPIANTQIYVLDPTMTPVPIGVAGELHIGGVGLARGYLNRPELTAERFIPDPFGSEPHARLYKTGDRATYLPDGAIEYLGRFDQQVKLRGFRIELGEIEGALAAHPNVREAAIVARGEGGDMRLVAYIVANEAGEAMLTSELRRFLTESLPEYMIPSAFVVLDALPLTPNGKLDRAALPAPAVQRSEHGQAAPQYRTGTEARLAQIWADVLGVDRVGPHEDFFELGGHSLLATRVISRVRKVFEIELPLRALFTSPTVSGLATAIDRAPRTGLSAAASAIVPLTREAHRRTAVGTEDVQDSSALNRAPA
ncbi:MAG: amino acid adenylation domain-containing protein [Vicinamibacterales bacterium]